MFIEFSANIYKAFKNILKILKLEISVINLGEVVLAYQETFIIWLIRPF